MVFFDAVDIFITFEKSFIYINLFSSYLIDIYRLISIGTAFAKVIMQ